MNISITNWSAWAPGLESRESWRDWLADPTPVGESGRPALDFVPALIRRRYSGLSRMVLQVAYDCCPEDVLKQVNVVTATRFGELATSLDLLKLMAQGEPVSPLGFSHSVHNAAAGHLSIAAHNTSPSSTVSGMEHTFCSSFMEAMTVVHRHPDQPVLLVVAEDTVPPDYYPLIGVRHFPHAVAFLLERDSEADSLSFRWEENPGREPEPDRGLPPVVEFLAWLISRERNFSIRSTSNCCAWEKTGAA